MNYIFGNNTLYPRSSRVGGTSGGQGSGLGVKQKLGPKRGSSEELAPPHTSSPSTSSPASSSPSTSSSRWQQLLTFFSRRSAFTDCINSSQVTTSQTCKVVVGGVRMRGGQLYRFIVCLRDDSNRLSFELKTWRQPRRLAGFRLKQNVFFCLWWRFLITLSWK